MKKLFHYLYKLLTISIFIYLNFFIFCTHYGSKETVAEKAMVASAHPRASSVGIQILKQGGNAVDAAMAMAFALSVAEPQASGIGGGGFMIIKMANSDEAIMVDYREMAPQSATPEFFYKTNSSFKKLTHQGFASIGIPGLVACANLILKKYGSMTLRQILEPSIKLAREGIVVSDKLNNIITENYEKIITYPATAAIYLSQGQPWKTGDLLKNEELAQTFDKIANNGAKIFYEGDIAKAIVDEVKKHGGIIELSDLKSYQAKIRKPVVGSYRGYQIISTAPPSGGGTHLIELLNIMEGFDIKAMGHNSAQFIHLFTEAMKMIYADKSRNIADPEFFAIPVDTFINKKYAERLRNTINKEKAIFNYTPPELINPESNNTSHLSVIDEAGNIVALTQSINSMFGSGVVVPGTGILLNDHLSDFDAQPNLPNSIAPHKRPMSSIAPTIIFKNGKPFMTVGTPGGTRIISALAQIIINVIDFNMSLDKAIEAPRVHCFKKLLHVEGRISKPVIEQLKLMGHVVKIHSAYDNYFGGAQGILINPKTHKLYGGADSRRDGVALGY